MNIRLTPTEEAELTLIQQDTNELINALLRPKERTAAGILAFPTMGLVGLVTEEMSGQWQLKLRLTNAPERLRPWPNNRSLKQPGRVVVIFPSVLRIP